MRSFSLIFSCHSSAAPTTSYPSSSLGSFRWFRRLVRCLYKLLLPPSCYSPSLPCLPVALFSWQPAGIPSFTFRIAAILGFCSCDATSLDFWGSAHGARPCPVVSFSTSCVDLGTTHTTHGGNVSSLSLPMASDGKTPSEEAVTTTVPFVGAAALLGLKDTH